MRYALILHPSARYLAVFVRYTLILYLCARYLSVFVRYTLVLYLNARYLLVFVRYTLILYLCARYLLVFVRYALILYLSARYLLVFVRYTLILYSSARYLSVFVRYVLNNKKAETDVPAFYILIMRIGVIAFAIDYSAFLRISSFKYLRCISNEYGSLYQNVCASISMTLSFLTAGIDFHDSVLVNSGFACPFVTGKNK